MKNDKKPERRRTQTQAGKIGRDKGEKQKSLNDVCCVEIEDTKKAPIFPVINRSSITRTQKSKFSKSSKKASALLAADANVTFKSQREKKKDFCHVTFHCTPTKVFCLDPRLHCWQEKRERKRARRLISPEAFPERTFARALGRKKISTVGSGRKGLFLYPSGALVLEKGFGKGKEVNLREKRRSGRQRNVFGAK